MDYDSVLAKIGGWGLYQKNRCAIFCIAAGLFGAFGHFALVVMLLTPPYWCPSHVEESFENYSAPIRNISKIGVVYPEHEVKNPLELDFCKMPENGSNLVQNNCLKSGKWQFNISETGKTLVTEYNLVCNDHWLVGLALMHYTIGDAIGVFLLPFFTDNLGRKRTFFVGMSIHIIAGSLSVLVPSLPGFLIFRLICSIAPAFCYITLFVWAMETVLPERRSFIANGSQVLFSSSIAAVGLIGYLCKDWVYFGLATTMPLGIFFLINGLVLDESVRWLLLKKGKKKEIMLIINKIIKINRSTVEAEDILEFMTEKDMFSSSLEEQKQVRLLALLTNKNLRPKLLALSMLFTIAVLSYYTLQFNVENIPGNPFLLFSMSALVEIPAAFANGFLVQRFGCIRITTSLYLIGGFCSILTGFSPIDNNNGHNWNVISLAMFSKGCLTATFISTFQIASEHFPTEARGTGVGFCAFVAYSAKILMPLIRQTATVYKMMPFAIIGLASLAAGVICLLIPETKGVSLPQTFEDAYAIGSVGFQTLLENVGCGAARIRRKNTAAAIRLLRNSSSESQRDEDGVGAETDENKLDNFDATQITFDFG